MLWTASPNTTNELFRPQKLLYYIINDRKSFCISIGRQTVCGVLGTHLQVIAADDLVISSSEQKATVNAHAGHDAIVVMQLPSKPCCLQALTLALSQIVTRSIHAHLAGQPSQFHPQTGLPLHMENHALTVQQSKINTKKCKTFQFWFYHSTIWPKSYGFLANIARYILWVLLKKSENGKGPRARKALAKCRVSDPLGVSDNHNNYKYTRTKHSMLNKTADSCL